MALDFTRHGVEVDSKGARWGLALRGYGYGDQRIAVRQAAPQAKANRIEYERGALTEWYINGPLGLEQGFTLAQPPGKASGKTNDLPRHPGAGVFGRLDGRVGRGGNCSDFEGEERSSNGTHFRPGGLRRRGTCAAGTVCAARRRAAAASG